MLNENQRQQQADCEDIDCDCSTPLTQDEWTERMRAQGWNDFGIDFDFVNPAHEDDQSYDKGHTEAYENR